MLKKDKEQFLNIIDVMTEAHDQVIELMNAGDMLAVCSLLVDCQDAAITLGQSLEKSVGEAIAAGAVGLLEEYCEKLYLLHERLVGIQTLSQTDSEYVFDIFKKLLELVDSVKLQISEMPCKREVLFMPYKASMWDSLESIWMAAANDPSCAAYVIPIPYFDRNEDGSAGELHYEGELFPDYVPITHYESYDYVSLRPDVIYIHNPYDEHNFATSVHPFFYSKNLKQYTDCLVYVPYFVTAGVMGDGQALCSAYIHSDYIIAQSDLMRQYYDPRVPSDKIVALGSPKVDRVVRMCREAQIMRDEAGGFCAVEGKLLNDIVQDKRIYFYNTSIGGMLHDTEAFLKKLRYVFDCFDGRDDVTILWRPHPLLESTIKSLRADFYEEYLKLKNWFVESEIGSYDDTPDIDLSIARSYAYIGDGATSVTALFGFAGKPIFILNNNIGGDIDLEVESEVPDECFDSDGEAAEVIHGFHHLGDGLSYECHEDDVNTLSSFLDGNITGGQFDLNEQQKAFSRIAVNCDGSCGEKIHEYITELVN